MQEQCKVRSDRKPMLRGRKSNCMFSAEPFPSFHFNLSLTFLLVMCVVLVSAPGSRFPW